MHYDYMSELNFGFHSKEHDFDWWKASLLSLPTDELLEVYHSMTAELDDWREREPPRKRNNKIAYISWIDGTHYKIDLLNEIADELRSRGR